MSGHQTELLGAYAIGVLDGDEFVTVQAHVTTCTYCQRELDDLREMEAALGEIPPEAFLDGPPRDGDLLLHRTLRQVRDERHRREVRRRVLVAGAAVVAGVAVLGGGALAGRAIDPPPSTTEAVSTLVAGTRTGAATDPASGATMTVAVQPAAGWVRVRATVDGIPAGEECRLYVVSRDGSRREAGSWLVPAAGRTTVDGSALTALTDVASVNVENFAGRLFVSVPL